MDWTEEFAKRCLELIDSIIKDKKLCEVLKECVVNSEKKVSKDSFYRYIHAYNLLLLKLKNKRCIDLDWSFICSVVNSDFKKELTILELDRHSERYQNIYTTLAKGMLEDIYIFLIEKNSNSLVNIKGLKKYFNLFKFGMLNSRKYDFSDISFIKSIKSKYPLNSSIESIYQVSYKTINRKRLLIDVYNNINLNTNSIFLMNLLKEFIDYEKNFDRKNFTDIAHLCFYYFFEESFGDNVPLGITDFNTKTFEIQYNFYIKKEKFLEKYKTAYPLKRILIHMYQYIDKKISDIGIEYDIFYNSWINVNLLTKNSFCETYEAGYIHIEHNLIEEYPKSDLWWLSSNNRLEKSTSSNKNIHSKLDFTIFEDDNIKNQVKDFIWSGNGTLRTRINYFFNIKEFFIFMYQYIDKISIKEKGKVHIPFELIWDYNVWLNSVIVNSSTIRNRYKAVRSFFDFNKDKYSINKKTLDILTLVEEEKDGTPISVEDFKILEREFKRISQNENYKDSKLFYYIFILASTSNLRLGEIFSLERDCIVYKDNNGNGIVKALRKTSNGKYKEDEYPAHIIRLIELAKKETEYLTHLADENIKNHIFLLKYRNRIHVMGTQFRGFFNKILKENREKLSRHYTPNNLRHTFINIIYDEINNGTITIDEAQQITGNTYDIVMKNYRRKLEIKDYAEVMYGISISNVDIQGKVAKQENEIENKGIVMKELGACNEDECIGSTLCLACNHFVTTLSKMPMFEKEIQKLKDEMKNSNDKYRKKEMELEINLLGAYLVKMLKLRKGSK